MTTSAPFFSPVASQELIKRGWPGLEQSEAPEGEETGAAFAGSSGKLASSQAPLSRRLPGLPSGPAPATRSVESPGDLRSEPVARSGDRPQLGGFKASNTIGSARRAAPEPAP